MSLFAFVLVLVLVACGDESAAPVTSNRPAAAAVPTSTPRPTPLATLAATPAPVGDPQRPVLLLFAVPGGNPGAEAEQAGRALQSALEEQLTDELEREFTVEIRFVTESEALNALCNGTGGNAAAAWVNAFSYHAAARQCGAVPVLALQRAEGSDEVMGQTVEIIARRNIRAINGLSGQTFCRLSGQDFTSWVFPSLILASRGVDPFTGLGGTKETYEDENPDDLAMLRAVYNNQCAAAALPPGEFEDSAAELARSLSTDNRRVTEDNVRSALYPLVPAADTSTLNPDEGYLIPYEVLVFPPDSMIPADIREAIGGALADIFADRRSGTAQLAALFARDDLPDAAGVVAVTEEDYAAFRALVGDRVFTK